MNPIIAHIVGQKRLAVVGVSDRDFGGAIYTTLKQRGYDVVPVHPTRSSFAGDTCYPNLRAVPAGLQAAVIAVSPENADAVVDDAVSANIPFLWFQQGKDFSRAIAKAETNRLQTVSRKCILMYAQPVTGIHAFHRFLVRAVGRL